MRALAIILSTIFVCASTAHAESANFNVTSSFFNSEGQALVTTAQQANTLSSQTYEVSASSGLVKNRYRVRLKSNQVKRDVTNYFYVDRFGETVSLKDSFNGEEANLGGGGDFVYRSWTFSADAQKTVTDSPIAATTGVVKIQYSSYNTGTDASLELLSQTLNRPESFFRNAETNFLGSVPEKLRRKEARVQLSQLLTEDLKISAHVVGAQRIEEGRDNAGVGAKTLWALADNVSLFGGLEHRQDIKGELPKDNRGYFDLTSYEAGLGYEINYNLIVKIVAGTTVEHETARGVSPRQTVGTDGYAAGLDYAKARFSAKLFTKLEQSNTGFKSFQFTGGLAWEI